MLCFNVPLHICTLSFFPANLTNVQTPQGDICEVSVFLEISESNFDIVPEVLPLETLFSYCWWEALKDRSFASL